MAFDLVTITTQPAKVTVTDSGFFHNLGDGRGYLPLDMFIHESPSTFADGTFESYAIGAGAPRGWVGLTGTGAEGASYSVVSDGTKAARLTVGSGTLRSARLMEQTVKPCVPGQTVRFSVSAKATDPTRGRLRFNVLGYASRIDIVTVDSPQYTLVSAYQNFAYDWVVPNGVTSYRAGITYGTADGGTIVDAGSSLTMDNFTAAVVSASNLPSVPTQVNYSQGTSSVAFTWAAPASNGGSPVTGYFVGRDGVDIHGTGAWSTTVPATQNSLTFLSLRAGDTYNFTIAAINANGQGTAHVTTVTMAAAPVTSNWSLYPYAANSIWKLGRSESATFESATATKTAALLNNGVPGDGQVWVNEDRFSHHMEYATESDPIVSWTDRSDASRNASYRVPLTARPTEPPPSEGGDAHMHILQPDGYTLREAFGVILTNAGTASATYSAHRLATSDLRGSGIGPQAGTRAYGGGAMAGLIRRHEVDTAHANFVADPRYPGQNVPLVRHALAFAIRDNQLYWNSVTGSQYGYFGDDNPLDPARYPGWPSNQSRRGFMIQAGYVWPATEQDYDSPSGNGHYLGPVPMGTYFAIPTGVSRPAVANIEALTASEKAMLTVFHALQDYGAYVTDRSGSVSLYVEFDPLGTTTRKFAEALIETNYNVRPLRNVLNLCRIVTNNNHASPNGGAPGSTRRGS